MAFPNRSLRPLATDTNQSNTQPSISTRPISSHDRLSTMNSAQYHTQHPNSAGPISPYDHNYPISPGDSVGSPLTPPYDSKTLEDGRDRGGDENSNPRHTNQDGPPTGWHIPPRPKPGRKPVKNSPPTKRRAQNREAQRLFRERRVMREEELKKELAQFRAERTQWNEENADKLRYFENEIVEARRRADAWRQEAEHRGELLNEALKKVESHRPSSSGGPMLPATNEMNQYGSNERFAEIPELEIDFTTPRNTAPSGGLSTDIPTDHCGFCDRPDNCICRQQEPFASAEPQLRSNDKLPTLEPVLRPSGPGSCSSCLEDPERRKFCQRLATVHSDQLRAPETRAFTGDSANHSTGIQSSNIRSCSDTYNYLSKHVPNFQQKKDSFAFMEQLQTHPVDPNRTGDPSTGQVTTPYEVDCASVLTTLARSGETPMDRRPSS